MEIGKLTLAELQEANPSLVDLIKAEGRKESETRISEMEEKVEAAETADGIFDQLRKLLKIDEKTDIVQAVGDVVEKVENVSKDTLREKVAAIVGSKVKGDKARAAVMRLVPVTEMEGKSDEELEKAVGDLFDTDEVIKSVVTEMEGGAGPLTNSGNGDRHAPEVGKSGMVKAGSTKL